MMLVSPQPMETLPERGYVIAQFKRPKQHGDFVFVDEWLVDWIREPIINEGVEFTAWSYTATTKEPT